MSPYLWLKKSSKVPKGVRPFGAWRIMAAHIGIPYLRLWRMMNGERSPTTEEIALFEKKSKGKVTAKDWVKLKREKPIGKQEGK